MGLADSWLEFRILGPIEVARAGRLARLRGRGPRVVLCTLLFNRNRAVSTDRLVEALWGERAPPTATKTVQVYVSQMRKEMAALGGDAERQLETHGHGYLLRVEPGQLDADRFQSLAEQGRELHAAGDAEAAASRLEAALALWRGPVLADLAYEEAAREEIARLDELRVAAIEERIDADLDRGRHAELIPELQGLVGQHPTRERLRRQLMLALYRSGRQIEAVNAYADARRALSEQLGIDPGADLRDLERRILAHDPTLAPPPSATAIAHAADGRRRWLVLAGAALLLAAAVAAAAVELTSGGSRPGIATLAGDSVGLIEPTSGRIVGQFPVGATPSQVVAGAHAMWTANTDQSIVARIDLATGHVRRAGFSTPTGLALGAGSLWVTSTTPLGNSGSYAIRLLRLDPSTLRQQAPAIVLAARTRLARGRTPILVTAGRVWAAAGPGKLVGVDAASGRISRVARIVHPRFGAVDLTGIAALDGAIWAMTDGRAMVRIDLRSGAVTWAAELSVISFGTMTAGAGSLWVTDPGYGRVWRIDPHPPYNRHDIITGLDASDIAFGDGAVWVTGAVDGTLTRIDPATEHLRRFPVGNTPSAVTVSAAGVLVSAAGGSESAAAGSTAPAGGVVAADACGPVISGGVGRPRYLIVADLALGPTDAAYTQRMAQAVEYELRAHHFSAGRYSLGLQVCDDSGTNGCTANPKAYAATPSVIGVIGPNYSSCSGPEISALSRAGVAMVAPTPNALDLTLPTSGYTYYPTGTRNFVRLSSRYDQWGIAAAEVGRRLGVHRVYVYVDDPGGSYGGTMVQTFARKARRLGVEVIGPDSPTGGFRRLARRLKARGVDGVFLASQTVDLPLIAALRDGLGRTAPLIAPDPFLPLECCTDAQTRRAERGMYVLGEDITDPARQLPPAGRAFEDAFGATRPAGTSDAWAPAAAQATDVLLTAIARSDGTRASVIHHLFRVRVRNGILGSFAFTPRGDISPARVLVYRVIRGPALTRPVTVITTPASVG